MDGKGRRDIGANKTAGSNKKDFVCCWNLIIIIADRLGYFHLRLPPLLLICNEINPTSQLIATVLTSPYSP